MSAHAYVSELAPNEQVTAEEWEAQQAQLAGLTVRQLRRHARVDVCPCHRIGCSGWRLVPRAAPTTREVVMDRDKYPTKFDVLVAVWAVRPRLELISARKMKLRHGKVVPPQGRRDSSGSLGRPVWLVEVRLLGERATSALPSEIAEAGQGSTT